MVKIERKHLHDAVICKQNDSVLEVAKIMRDTQTRYILVVNESLHPVGLITPFDIVKRAVAEEKDLSGTNAKEVMSSPVIFLEIGENYETAAEKMASLETFRIPVVEHGKLVGILDYSVVFRELCKVKNDSQ